MPVLVGLHHRCPPGGNACAHVVSMLRLRYLTVRVCSHMRMVAYLPFARAAGGGGGTGG